VDKRDMGSENKRIKYREKSLKLVKSRQIILLPVFLSATKEKQKISKNGKNIIVIC